jgi:hypothetical protein
MRLFRCLLVVLCIIAVQVSRLRGTQAMALSQLVRLANQSAMQFLREQIYEMSGIHQRFKEGLPKKGRSNPVGLEVELAIHVGEAERTGDPGVLLKDVPTTGRTSTPLIRPRGFTLPERLPAMLFGDGDTLKTWAADAVAVDLARRGIPTAIVDAEMTIDTHVDRAHLLTEGRIPDGLLYLGATRPLIHERGRLAEEFHKHGIRYAIFDSVAFLCHDKPEAADSAMAYFRAIRSLGPIGSLHLAHTTKGEDGIKSRSARPSGSTASARSGTSSGRTLERTPPAPTSATTSASSTWAGDPKTTGCASPSRMRAPSWSRWRLPGTRRWRQGCRYVTGSRPSSEAVLRPSSTWAPRCLMWTRKPFAGSSASTARRPSGRCSQSWPMAVTGCAIGGANDTGHSVPTPVRIVRKAPDRRPPPL